MTLAAYLDKPWAEKVLLVEIDTATPLYLSDTAYITEPGDTPANQPYHPIIAPGGIPRLSRKIQELWGGKSLATWGGLQLATSMAGAVNLATVALRGKTLRLLVTGPRKSVARADAAVVLTGVVGGRSGNVDEGVMIEVRDRKQAFNEAILPPNTYDAATMGGGFPAENHGRSKPLCLGTCRNISPVLIDSGTYTYQINDGAVQAISQVYDNGIAAAYTTNLPAGTFTLTYLPAGVVTADAQGMKDGATFLSTTTQIIDYLARTYGAVSGGDIDISGLPGDVVGIYINAPVTLAEVVTMLLRGVLGWWGFDRADQLRVRLFEAPAAGGQEFGETRQLSDLTWDEEPDIIWSVPLLYARNWTRTDSPAAAVALGMMAWLKSEGFESRVETAGIKTTYPTATASPRLGTYFDGKTPAETVAGRALTLFGTLRRRVRVTVPITATPLELGDSVTLVDAGILTGNWRIIGITERWDGEIPLADLELWG